MKKVETKELGKVVGGSLGKEQDAVKLRFRVQCTRCGNWFTPIEHEIDLSHVLCDDCKKKK